MNLWVPEDAWKFEWFGKWWFFMEDIAPWSWDSPLVPLYLKGMSEGWWLMPEWSNTVAQDRSMLNWVYVDAWYCSWFLIDVIVTEGEDVCCSCISTLKRQLLTGGFEFIVVKVRIFSITVACWQVLSYSVCLTLPAYHLRSYTGLKSSKHWKR
jgi:hypothetical protein